MKQPRVITFADKVLSGIESIQPFSENRAWTAYRAAALGEAFGWTVLIIGILIHHFHWFGSSIAIPIAGQTHGMLFLIYFGVLISTYTSLRWSRATFLIAIIAGVPPYGSLVFEQYKSHTRRNKNSRQHFRSILLARATGTI